MRRALPPAVRRAIAATLPPIVTTAEKIAALRIERADLLAKRPTPGITESLAEIDAAISRLSNPKEPV